MEEIEQHRLNPVAESKSTAELISDMADVAQSRPDRRTDMAFSYCPKYVNAWVTADGELKQKGRGELPEREAAELVWQHEHRMRIRRYREAEDAEYAAKTRANCQERNTYRIANTDRAIG